MLLAHQPTTPYSESQYYNEGINKDIIFEDVKPAVRKCLEVIQNIVEESNVTPSNDRTLNDALKRQKGTKSELEQLLKDVIEKTDFTNIHEVSNVLNKVQEKLNECYKYTNRVINSIPEKLSHKSKGKGHLSNHDKIPFQEEAAQYELLSDLFTCVNYSIQIVNEESSCNESLEAAIKAAESLKKKLHKLSDDLPSIINNQIKQLDQLFGIVAINEFLKNGSIPRKLKETIFDWPSFDLSSEVKDVYLHLTKTLSESLSKQNEALECYKAIITKNKSISKMSIIACREIAKHGQYKQALDLLEILEGFGIENDVGGGDREGLLCDISILKLFCYVGLEEFHNAEGILRILPKDVLDIEDIKSLKLTVEEYLPNQKTQDEVFSVPKEHFLKKFSEWSAQYGVGELEQKKFIEQLSESSLAKNKEFDSNFDQKEGNIQGGLGSEGEKVSPKKLNLSGGVFYTELKSYISTPDDMMQYYNNEFREFLDNAEEISSLTDLYSLILQEAIKEKSISTIDKILNNHRDVELLLHLNQSNENALLYAIKSNDKAILDLLYKYIQEENVHHRTYSLDKTLSNYISNEFSFHITCEEQDDYYQKLIVPLYGQVGGE